MNYTIVKSNIDLANKVINFFTSRFTNPELHSDIIKELAGKGQNDKYLAFGYFTLADFQTYYHIKEPDSQLSLKLIEIVLDALEKNLILQSAPFAFPKRYLAHDKLSVFYYTHGLILNLICGWKHIIDRYNTSVFKVVPKLSYVDDEGCHQTKESIGTGFYCLLNDNPIIITNKHNVQNTVSFRVLNIDENEIEYNNHVLDEKRDLAYIFLKNIPDTPTFHFNENAQILSELLTIGYPTVPFTKYAYPLYHKGELNSFVEDYHNNKYFLFSAKTSSGNSGSPIIDHSGMIIGIVTQELFDEHELLKKGKLPYYAGIPVSEIVDSLNEYVFS